MENNNNAPEVEVDGAVARAEAAAENPRLKALKDSLDSFRTYRKKKLYPVESKDGSLVQMRNIIATAPWKGREALGVEKLADVLSKATPKGGYIFLSSTEIRALDFFVSSHAGTGLEAAKEHVLHVRAIIRAIALVESDERYEKDLDVTIRGMEQGIEVKDEDVDNLIKAGEENVNSAEVVVASEEETAE